MRPRITLFIIYLLFNVSHAHAKDWGLQPRLVAGFAQYELNKTIRSSASQTKLESSGYLPTYGLGVAGYWRDWYVDLYAQTTPTDVFSASGGAWREAKRYDNSYSVGYRIQPWLLGFLGYKTGKTELSDTFTEAYEDLSTGETTLQTINYDSTFEEKGPFIGVSGNLRIGSRTALGATLAYASVSGREVSAAPAPIGPVGGIGEDEGATSRARGLSYGVSVKSAFLDHFVWSNSITCQRYVFEYGPDYATHDPTAYYTEVTEKFCGFQSAVGYEL